MYDQFLSSQWIFDRCLHAETHFILIVILTTILLTFPFWYLLTKGKLPKKESIELRVAVVVMAVFAIAPIVFFASLFGGLITCRTGWELLKGIDAAHPIHAVIKERYKAGEDMPKNLSDIRRINPERYDFMVKNSKVAYVYDEKANSYTLFVRPSEYYVAVFDNKNDYKIYELTNVHYRFDSGALKYPPDYPGPWDKLPK